MKRLRSSLLAVASVLLLAACAAPPVVEPRPPLTEAEWASLDPKWQPFRSYLQPMFDRIGRQWDRILIESRVYPKIGTRAVVRFRLNARGQVVSIVSVEGDTDALGKKAAVNAVASAGPFGPWTPELIAALGDSAELTFTFQYQ